MHTDSPFDAPPRVMRSALDKVYGVAEGGLHYGVHVTDDVVNLLGWHIGPATRARRIALDRA